MSLNITHSRGFTLVELMIVIGIIGILMTMSVLPFGSYMDRSALRQERDEIQQEWILAHKSVRNGIQFEKDDETTAAIDEGKHAHILFEFIPNTSTIKVSLLENPDPTEWSTPNNKKPHKTIKLDRKIQVLGFSGGTQGKSLNYIIAPPYATGAFYENTNPLPEDHATLIIGYPGSDEHSGRQKKIYLRPYLR